MLAEKICALFSMSDYDNDRTIKNASERHSKVLNSQSLLEIYRTIRENE